MGLRVGKTLVIKKSPEAPTAQGEANQATPDDATKIMFDLEKVNMEEIVGSSLPTAATEVEEDGEEDNATGGHTPIDIFKLQEKARVTFDDILISLQAQETQKPSDPSDDELSDI